MQIISKTHYAQMHENAQMHNAIVKKSTKKPLFMGFFSAEKVGMKIAG